MVKIIDKYMNFILSTKPSKLWKVIRFFLHWITLPIKLILIGSLGLYQIIHKTLTSKKRIPTTDIPSIEKKRKYFNKILNSLPILRTNEFESYVNRVPYYSMPDGCNHNPDHQTSRHSTYYFLMNKLGLTNEKMKIATRMFMQGKWLIRGFTKMPYENKVEYNVGSVSGDMLCGLNLAVMSEDDLNENFDHIIASIIENDYALLEGRQPEIGDPGAELYSKLFAQNDYRMERVPMKSSRGMWQPGIETVGAQALTILAALRVAEVKNRNREAGREYRKLLWKYGYGLLSIFPTAYTDKSRGYFNDHNCMIALYVLSKLSKSRWGKLFWKIPMIYVWSLSKHWYNGYFTGLLKECYPESVSTEYINTCLTYLYEFEPDSFAYTDTIETISPVIPVTYADLNADEFSPDIRYDKISKITMKSSKIKTGLGYIASAILLENEPKELLDKHNR